MTTLTRDRFVEGHSTWHVIMTELGGGGGGGGIRNDALRRQKL